jgi:uncharacterized membrane protein
MEQMNERHRILLVLGIIVLIIGLFCSFYQTKTEKQELDAYGRKKTIWAQTYPYQALGIALSISGMVLATLSLLLPEKK